MPVLAAAVAIVGVLCLLNLLLTFGVIRRLREHTQLIANTRAAAPPLTSLVAGEQVDDFTAVATDGESLSGPAGLHVVGFFSSSCSACPERVEPFVNYLAAHRIAPEQALSVLVGADRDTPPYADRLAEASRVCAEPDDGALTKAFKVVGFPAFCVLDSTGALVTASYDPERLAEAAPVS